MVTNLRKYELLNELALFLYRLSKWIGRGKNKRLLHLADSLSCNAIEYLVKYQNEGK